MNELFQRPRYSRALKNKVSRRLLIMVKGYINLCQEIQRISEQRYKLKDFEESYAGCQLYFNSISVVLTVKEIANRILTGRKHLLAILPKEFNPRYQKSLSEFNAIVQYCMDERRTRNEISDFHAKELQEN
jgi:hypothetical protein